MESVPRKWLPVFARHRFQLKKCKLFTRTRLGGGGEVKLLKNRLI